MAARGGTGTLLIAFVSPAGKEPIALQWKIALGTEVTAAGEIWWRGTQRKLLAKP